MAKRTFKPEEILILATKASAAVEAEFKKSWERRIDYLMKSYNSKLWRRLFKKFLTREEVIDIAGDPKRHDFGVTPRRRHSWQWNDLRDEIERLVELAQYKSAKTDSVIFLSASEWETLNKWSNANGA